MYIVLREVSPCELVKRFRPFFNRFETMKFCQVEFYLPGVSKKVLPFDWK